MRVAAGDPEGRWRTRTLRKLSGPKGRSRCVRASFGPDHSLTSSHQAVLVTEAVSLLKPGVGKVIVDGTLGGGGHAEALLGEGAIVVGIDRDPRAIEAVSKRLERFAGRFNPIQGNYADAESLLAARGLLPVDGILLDLGISSAPLQYPARAFSFQVDLPLHIPIT